MKALESLEIIKNAPTIYVGCGSDIYTRYPFECKEIEKGLEALELIKDLAKVYDVEFCDKDQTMSFKIAYRHHKFILETITFKDKKQYNLLKETLIGE